MLAKFQIALLKFEYEINDEKTRKNIMSSLDQVVRDLRDGERVFNYTLMKKFVDSSTVNEIFNGKVNIQVELIDGRIVDIVEYCDIMTDIEKYKTLLKWGVYDTADKFFKNNKL